MKQRSFLISCAFGAVLVALVCTLTGCGVEEDKGDHAGTVENSRYNIEVEGTPDGCKAHVYRDSIEADVYEEKTDYDRKKWHIVAHLSCEQCMKPQRVDLCRSIHTERDCKIESAECPAGTVLDIDAAGDEPFQCYAENGHYPPDLARRIGKVCKESPGFLGSNLMAKKMRGNQQKELSSYEMASGMRPA